MAHHQRLYGDAFGFAAVLASFNFVMASPHCFTAATSPNTLMIGAVLGGDLDARDRQTGIARAPRMTSFRRKRFSDRRPMPNAPFHAPAYRRGARPRLPLTPLFWDRDRDAWARCNSTNLHFRRVSVKRHSASVMPFHRRILTARR
jgi:hypothetical protein